MNADIIDLAAQRALRGLVSIVPPADIFLPPPGKRIGDRVRERVAGQVGTVIGTRPSPRGFILKVQFPHVTAHLMEGSLDPA